MSEPKLPQRDTRETSVSVLHIVLSGFLLLGGIQHLIDRKLAWAVVYVAVVAGSWLNIAWARRTPLVRVESGVLVIHRQMLSRPLRVSIGAITSVDESHPARVRLVLQGGQAVSIPLHWFAWADRAPFMEYLRSVVRSGTW